MQSLVSKTGTLINKIIIKTAIKKRITHLSPCLPKEVIFAVQSAFSRKTFLRQITFALAALHALDVPGSVQHVEQKAVQDRPLAAGAVDHGFDWANNTADEARTNTQTGSTARAEH